MSDNDFVIKNGVLKKYTGNDSKVVIPMGVSVIWNGAFFDCKKISSVVIPDSVTEIRSTAFNGIQGKLKSVTFPNSKYLNIVNYDGYISVLSGCKSSINIIFPEGIETFKGTALERIWNHFFISKEKIIMMSSFLRQYTDLVKNDASLNKTFKANKTKIVELAIKNDDVKTMKLLFGLYKKISLDDLNKFIDMSTASTTVTAFLVDYKAEHYSAEKQQKIEDDKIEKELGFKKRTVADWKKIFKFETVNDKITITGYIGNETTVEIPEMIGKRKVNAIKAWAFKGCTDITVFIIPDSVTYIDSKAFNGCGKFVIKGSSGGYVEVYAKINGRKFEAI